MQFTMTKAVLVQGPLCRYVPQCWG